MDVLIKQAKELAHFCPRLISLVGTRACITLMGISESGGMTKEKNGLVFYQINQERMFEIFSLWECSDVSESIELLVKGGYLLIERGDDFTWYAINVEKLNLTCLLEEVVV